jgi:hypothetical protein
MLMMKMPINTMMKMTTVEMMAAITTISELREILMTAVAEM